MIRSSIRNLAERITKLSVLLISLFAINSGCAETLEQIVGSRLLPGQAGFIPVVSPDPEEPDALICDPAITTSFGGGDGSDENPYRICSVDHWLHWASDSTSWNKVIQLESDIDFTDVSTLGAIGDPTTKFTGEFRGNGKKIHRLSLSGLPAGFGLIGDSEGNVKISNLTLENVSFTTANASRFGILIGRHHSGVLEIDQVSTKMTEIVTSGDLLSIGLVGSASQLSADGVIIEDYELRCTDGPNSMRVGALVGNVGREFIEPPTAGAALVVTNTQLIRLKVSCTEAGTNSDGTIGGLIGGADVEDVLLEFIQVDDFLIEHTNSATAGIGALAGGIGTYGSTRNVTIRDVHVSGTFTQRATYGGFIAGALVAGTGQILIERVTGSSDAERECGRWGCGGLFGRVSVNSGAFILRNAVSKADLYVRDGPIGGLIGTLTNLGGGTATIEDSYANGNFRSNDTLSGTARLGGLVASIFNGPVQISRSYYSGTLSFAGDTPSRGCLVGWPGTGGAVTATDATWDSTLCTDNAFNSGAVAGASGRTTSALQTDTAFSNWLTPPWIFTSGQNPKLNIEP